MGRRVGMLFLAATVAALALAATPAAADPSAEENKNAFVATATCPGLPTFQVTVVGFVAFVDKNLLLVHLPPDTGNPEGVTCLATHPVFPPRFITLIFVERGTG
jgi:hypothetical protein